jgi:hypothetical protein
MIYVDRFRVPADVTDARSGRTYSSRWSHLVSDQIDPSELHAFAARVGMRREWFQPGHDAVGDHYDLTDPKRRKAVRLGAKEIDSYGLVDIMRSKRKALTMTATAPPSEDKSSFFAEPAFADDGADPLLESGRYRLPTDDGMSGKSHLHTRVTTIASVLPSSYGLSLWSSDRVAWAMAQRPDLCALLQSVPVDDVKTIREVRAKAEIISAMDQGANLGTATHNVLHRVDKGEPIESIHQQFWPDIRAYLQLLVDNGLGVIPDLIERVVRMRDYDIAGRLDNIMAESDGSLVVVDIKTKGDPEKVHEIATQLAPYANADEMYDESTGRFVPMPPVRRDYALMIHIHPGSGVATIKKIDIRRGLWSVEVAKSALAWQKMTHLATPYVMPSPIKPADSATVTRGAGVLTATAPTAPAATRSTTSSNGHPPADSYRPASQEYIASQQVNNGQVAPTSELMVQRPDFESSRRAADIANAVLDDAHRRVGSTEPHGVVIPQNVPATPASPPAPTTLGPTAGPVSAPDPATYGAPAGVTPPAAYAPQTVPERQPTVLPVTEGTTIEQEAEQIVGQWKSKSKAELQAYARLYQITDLNHHKKHIATSIATVRADRRKAGLPAEPDGEQVSPSAGRHPQTMTEAGLSGPVPDSPPGRPVVGPEAQQQPQPAAERPEVDPAEAAVLNDIGSAMTVERIGQIWTLWTTSGRAWSGNVQAAADARVAAIQAAPAGRPVGGDNEPPF